MRKISYYILENGLYSQEKDLYMGSFSHSDKISLKLQIWNNRYGTSHAEDIQNAKISIEFESVDDFHLINCCSVIVDSGKESKPSIEMNRGIIELGSISGDTNDGEANIANKGNYYDVEIIFNNIPSNVKNGLRNLYINIH